MRNNFFAVLPIILILVAVGCAKPAEKSMIGKEGVSVKDESATKQPTEESANEAEPVANPESMEKEDLTERAVMPNEDATESSQAQNAEESATEATFEQSTVPSQQAYTGKVLAGSESTKYLDFNKPDYQKALKEKKKILLYFYANWCPICKREQPDTFAAFSQVKDPDLIGFRVNYRDSDTDADEEALAKEFGVSYQHTKVILKNGQRAGKFPDSWDKQRYLEELAKI
ncbi:thioredoxin family protein [Candidatus Woesearchaeota archaeon]|nr:thioredoxin family protein [Candidatus Woesearchaeota archaeon]